MKTEHERDVEILFYICLVICSIIVFGLIDAMFHISLNILPKPILNLLVVSIILGFIMGCIDIFVRDWKGW